MTEPRDPLVSDADLALVTDLYQLTMLQTYFEHGLRDVAVFELIVRSLPPSRNYLVFAGLGTALEHVERLRFSPSAIETLERLGGFKRPFLDHLATWRFTGDVFAIPEGTPVFPGEPLLQVVAPIEQAQLLETLVMNVVHFQTVIASKATRVVRAARGRPVVDFGLRRAHGLDAGMKAVRAGAIAGIEATSNVLAGVRYGLPVRGTMAHSAIEAFGSDLDAFRAFAQTDPTTTCLVDTFDTLEGIDAVIRLARELGDRFRVRAVRLDSGDLSTLAKAARAKLDAAGLKPVTIFASGGLDEHSIDRLLRDGAPIDGFGVGTTLDASSDAPTLDMAYKLVEYAGEGRLKLSPGKAILPCRKQVFRRLDDSGRAISDTVTLHDETSPGRPLLEPAMTKGRVLPVAMRPVASLAEDCRRRVAELPPSLLDLDAAPPFDVKFSERLRARRDEVLARVRHR